MASLVRKLVSVNKVNNLIFKKNPYILCNAVRNHWNYQYKPGPYPKTPEERAAAAKKYNMRPEEYEPYPEDENFGDYPKLKNVSADSKDISYPYDLPELKRNFNEPLHVDFEMIGEDRYDISYRHRISLWAQWGTFLGVIGGCYALYFFLEDYKMERPVIAKQLPRDGPHYSFERA